MMPRILPKDHLLRYFFVAILLIGAFALPAEKALTSGEMVKGQVAVNTCGSAATPKAIIKKKISSEAFSPFIGLKQKFSTDATIIHVNFTLLQVVATVLIKYFAVPAHELIPGHATITPGISFIAKIVPVIIQPNAP